MNNDPRYLALPDNIANDPNAVELVSTWFSADKVSAMTRTGTGLDSRPEIWGEILAAIAHNAAMASASIGNIDRAEVLTRMKAALDKHWEQPQPKTGQYYPSPPR